VNYEFLPEARDELWEAALYYASQEAGLGVRFRGEVAHVIERILADPYLWRERAGGIGESTARSFRITSPISSAGIRY